MASRGKGARIKGANFEREIAKLLTLETGVEFKRGLGQTRKGGEEVSDVQSDKFPQYHFELKRQQRCNIKRAMEQAMEDTKESGKIPIVVSKEDQGELLVTMRMENWLSFFKEKVANITQCISIDSVQ
jgi:Holliday junction resolvase